MESQWRKWLWRGLRIALTAGLLYWVLSRVGVVGVVATLGVADLRLLLLAALSYQVGVVVRAVRWAVLLRGSGVETAFSPILGLTYIGQFFNVALPTGVAGDVVRAVELKEHDSRAASAGIVILDRILGMVTLMTLVLVALALGHRLLPGSTALTLTGISAVGLVGLVGALQGNLVRRLTAFLPERFSLAGEGMLGRLYTALTGCAPSSVRLALLLSALNTALTVGIHYTVARAVGIDLGLGVFAMITPIVNLSLLLPSLGGFGLSEVGYQLLLTPLGVRDSVAVALGLGTNLARLSAALLGGLYYLLWASRR